MAKEKRESEAMKLLEEEHKQKTAMELLEQYLQFKQEADKENKKPKYSSLPPPLSVLLFVYDIRITDWFFLIVSLKEREGSIEAKASCDCIFPVLKREKGSFTSGQQECLGGNWKHPSSDFL